MPGVSRSQIVLRRQAAMALTEDKFKQGMTPQEYIVLGKEHPIWQPIKASLI